ncbi:MAG TPA: AI-2E family transporter [Candidatus Paceibacterota bacterium]|nr:AI-2E family transporter [Candidatus Paceibacterota bacterium]
MELRTDKRTIEYVYFFVVLAVSGYLVWQLVAPVISAVALAAIVATICYPMYERLLPRMPRKSPTLAALVSLLIVLIVIVIPLVLLSSLLLREAISIYTLFSQGDRLSIVEPLNQLNRAVQTFIPTFSIDAVSVVQQAAQFFVNNLVSIFAGTASTIFLFFIALIAVFYFFRDGRYFTAYLVSMSPLSDDNDTLILEKLARAVRSVALGSVFVAIIQGILTAIGLSLFGFDRAILWGVVASVGALVPSVGTSVVFIPSVIYLFMTGQTMSALGVALWGLLAVGLIDNLLGPYLMSRGNHMHPLVLLLSVLGGVALFGPIGFVLGPVVMSLFLVLLELYSTHFLDKENPV